jgi:glyoxylase-like metal-dependent hydrolase (beta-lactamase superfamily II)
MRFGEYECFSIETAEFVMDGGAMFGIVPKILWEKIYPADDRNRILLKSRSLLMKGKKRTILVDTGFGNKLPQRFKNNYQLNQKSDLMDSALSVYGLTRRDITDVIISHLHFDHAGGSTLIKKGKAVPAFPNALYHVQKEQWETAINPSARDLASYRKDDFIPLLKQGSLRLIDGTAELFKGIEVIVTHGHTPGQQHPLVRGDKNALFFCADLIPTVAHLPVPWHMAFDSRPLDLIKEKEKLLARALKEHWILFFEHDSHIAAASIREDEKYMKIDRIVSI